MSAFLSRNDVSSRYWILEFCETPCFCTLWQSTQVWGLYMKNVPCLLSWWCMQRFPAKLWVPYPEPQIKLLPSHANNDTVPGCWRYTILNAVNNEEQSNCAGRRLQLVVFKKIHVATDGGFYQWTAGIETYSESEQCSLKQSDSTWEDMLASFDLPEPNAHKRSNEASFPERFRARLRRATCGMVKGGWCHSFPSQGRLMKPCQQLGRRGHTLSTSQAGQTPCDCTDLAVLIDLSAILPTRNFNKVY